jgi:hypothetical protein
MSIEAANEVLEALGRDLILGQGLPVIAVNPLSPTWAAKCWVPPHLRPIVMNERAGDIAELSEVNDVYVGISVFGPWSEGMKQGINVIKAPTYGNFMRRTKANFVGMVAVMVDDVGDDDGTMGPGAKIEASRIKLTPSWKVCTSPSCWQYWYTLSSMCTEREIAERFIDDLVKSGLTSDSKDPGMRGVSRVGRLPMGVNSKPKYREGGKAAPEVFGEAFTGLRYSLVELGDAFGVKDVYRPVERKTFAGYSNESEAPTSFRIMEQFLAAYGMIKHDSGDEVLEITCPWLHTHGSKGDGPDDSGSKYFRPSVNNGFKGGFYCWHSKCQHKHILDLVRWAEEKAIKEMSKINLENLA